MATPGAPAARRLRRSAAVVTRRVVRPAALAAAAVVVVALVCGGAGPLVPDDRGRSRLPRPAWLPRRDPGGAGQGQRARHGRPRGRHDRRRRRDPAGDRCGRWPGRGAAAAGTYLLRSGIALKSGVVLRGEGKDRTHLIVTRPNDLERVIGADGRYVSDGSRSSTALAPAAPGSPSRTPPASCRCGGAHLCRQRPRGDAAARTDGNRGLWPRLATGGAAGGAFNSQNHYVMLSSAVHGL